MISTPVKSNAILKVYNLTLCWRGFEYVRACKSPLLQDWGFAYDLSVLSWYAFSGILQGKVGMESYFREDGTQYQAGRNCICQRGGRLALLNGVHF